MEVRRNSHGEGKLETITCISDDNGFAVASVIVLGKEEAVLLDTQWTLSNAHRVVAEILETGRKLTKVFISHAHPDHYFGSEVYQDAFPDAKIYALPEDIITINRELFGKLEHWQTVIGKRNCPHKPLNLIPFEDEYIEIEGEKIEVYKKVWGDLKYNTMIYIPSIKTLYGSDVLFNQAHPFTCEVSAKGRAKWRAEMDRFEKFNAEVIIPGHAKPGVEFNKKTFQFMRDYIDATEEEMASTSDAANFYYNMAMRFPEATLLRSNEMNANVFKSAREWYYSDEEDGEER
ncbi:MAG TPA: MBL fold metallo-hydrolase [Anaerovoracaceae bacterium]|nr:MBL fold metallo-hydrolase [Anaerovoracaceae bacterium]